VSDWTCEKWRNVLPNIGDFTFRLDDLKALGIEPWIYVDRAMDSLARRTDGDSFSRRATHSYFPRRRRVGEAMA